MHRLLALGAVSCTPFVRKWCVFEAMLKPVRPDPDRLAACRSGLEGELLAKLQRVESLIATGKRFGGLAALRSVELAGKIELMPK